jgi:diguanylate cyclase (GGDEF)-like protein
MVKKEKPSILLIDENLNNLKFLAGMLMKAGYDVFAFSDSGDALEFYLENSSDIILMDIRIPETISHEICRVFKRDVRTQDIPVIFISALDDTENKIKGFEAGCVDYITKPFNEKEVLARVKIHIRLKRAREKLKAALIKLRKAYRDLEIAAKTDSLTQLPNRRDILEKIHHEMLRSERTGRPFSLILCDIDDFKQFNDKHGHDFGDMVLIKVAEIIRHRLRSTDCGARWGGEEFLILLPETELEGAEAVAHAIRNNLMNLGMTHRGFSLTVQMTFGVIAANGSRTIDDCIKLADNALYKGKNSGKNCIVSDRGFISGKSGG